MFDFREAHYGNVMYDKRVFRGSNFAQQQHVVNTNNIIVLFFYFPKSARFFISKFCILKCIKLIEYDPYCFLTQPKWNPHFAYAKLLSRNEVSADFNLLEILFSG